jgi:hypothetical protein
VDTYTTQPARFLAGSVPERVWLAAFQEDLGRDPVTARRSMLLSLLWDESYQAQPGLMARVEAFQIMRDQERQVSGGDVERAVNDAFGSLADNGNALLLADAAIAIIQGRCLGDDDLIQHQDDRSLPLEKPAFQPPFAWRQVWGRKERV